MDVATKDVLPAQRLLTSLEFAEHCLSGILVLSSGA